MREKPTLILLHGGPGADHSIFRPEFDALADVAQVIFLDLRGQGRSDKSAPERRTLAQWGDDVRGFCDALGIERPIVHGHSFGGMVAMAYATRHPEHPGKLVLSATYARQNIPRVAQRCEELGGPEVRDAAQRMWSEPGPEAQAEYNRLVLRYYTRELPSNLDGAFRVRFRNDVGLQFAAGEMQSFDLLRQLSTLVCPVLVLGGALDPVCPIEDQEDIAAALPADRVSFERFEECGHMIWIDAPERYFRALREFVAS